MHTQVITRSSAPALSWERVKHHAYFFREAAIATLAFGIYLHVTRLVFGDELMLRYLLTPTVDKAFAIPMTYAAVSGLVGWTHLRFRSRAHRIGSAFIVGFIVISAPVHIATYFGASMARLSAFPTWYSLMEGAFLYPAFAVTVWHIQAGTNDE
jgi:hypothetical protein